MKSPFSKTLVAALNRRLPSCAVPDDVRSGESFDLVRDPRSVRSMLACCDDGRSAIFERFQRKLTCAAPHLDDNEIDACYCRFEFAARLTILPLPRNWHMAASRWLMCIRSYGDPMLWLRDAQFRNQCSQGDSV